MMGRPVGSGDDTVRAGIECDAVALSLLLNSQLHATKAPSLATAMADESLHSGGGHLAGVPPHFLKL